ncbi:MAG: sigma-54 dependent transcriptional regulator [bacterium]
MSNFNGIVGKSAKMQQVYHLIDISANTNVPVHIYGETGTGKELVARAIHNRSKRRNYIPINCAAIPHDLAESELFGHEKGAFTSAIKDRLGKLELAQGGTILFDEIGEMSIPLQAKLLRVVEDKIFYRVGGTKPINVDIRIISATNKSLLTQVKNGQFRDDLYYRLSVFQINLPPLRERKEDIPELVKHFIKMANEETNKDVRDIDSLALTKLMEYDWPGNIRQLSNCILKAVIIASRSHITIDDIHLPIFIPTNGKLKLQQVDEAAYDKKGQDSSSLVDLEITAIKRMLEEKNGNKKETAKALGIGRSSLYWKIRRYNLA